MRFPLLPLTATVTREPEVPTPLMPKKVSFSEKFPGQIAVDRIFCVCVCVSFYLMRSVHCNVLNFTN